MGQKWNEGPGQFDKVGGGQMHFFPALCNVEEMDAEFKARGLPSQRYNPNTVSSCLDLFSLSQQTSVASPSSPFLTDLAQSTQPIPSPLSAACDARRQVVPGAQHDVACGRHRVVHALLHPAHVLAHQPRTPLGPTRQLQLAAFVCLRPWPQQPPEPQQPVPQLLRRLSLAFACHALNTAGRPGRQVRDQLCGDGVEVLQPLSERAERHRAHQPACDAPAALAPLLLLRVAQSCTELELCAARAASAALKPTACLSLAPSVRHC
eukprot:1849919-Rhodomonas_salina.2